MSSTQLWAPKPQRPSENAATNMKELRANMVPGTWLQLSPSSSTVPSPAVKPDNSPVSVDELTLTPANAKFLSNASRTSSISSTSSVRHPALGQRSNLGPSIERREMSVRRLGGVGGAFLSNE